MLLPDAFWESLREALASARLSGKGSPQGESLSEETILARFSAALEEESPACVRLNPWKKAHLPILEGAAQVPWSEEGWRLLKRPVYTLHPLFHAGAYYVQDASSMFVGAVLRRVLQLPEIQEIVARRPVCVLDLCAAPGGKTTDAAASLRKAFGDGFELLANEYNPHRFAILKDNVEIWGDPQVSVCNTQAARLGQMNGYFDIIIVDAPCSGEGMFRKEPQAVEQWTPKKVEECAALQRSILDDIAPALAPGGYLIYSTCTYNTQENEGSVRHLLESRAFEAVDLKKLMFQEASAAEAAGETLLWSPLSAAAASDAAAPAGAHAADADAAPIHAVRLIPGLVHGEGQFCALLHQIATLDVVETAGESASVEEARNGMMGRERRVARDTVSGARVYAPAASPDCPTSYALDRSRWPNVPVDKQTALNFLHGDSLVLPDAPKGLLLLTYKDIPLGFVKNIGARCNNLYPKSRRIKMDVKL
ncbi:MAG: hypothetical protein IJR34_04420 [Bacteroidales bacterium]|nr:hypothetical protein [Bacteroidales bacterium]